VRRLAFVVALLLAPQCLRAATVTHAINLTTSSNLSVYTTTAFTPAAYDLLFVYVVASGTAQQPGVVSSSTGTTFTRVAPTATNVVRAYIANAKSTNTSQTVSFDCTGDGATGAIVNVVRIAGMSRVGTSALLQGVTTNCSGAAGTAPACTFAASALTENPTLGLAENTTNPAGVTPPGSWAEQSDTGYGTPTIGAEYVTRDSGFTGTTITWASTSASAWAAIIHELDTSAAAAGCSNLIALLGAGCK
jgi:hypothetical protein